MLNVYLLIFSQYEKNMIHYSRTALSVLQRFASAFCSVAALLRKSSRKPPYRQFPNLPQILHSTPPPPPRKQQRTAPIPQTSALMNGAGSRLREIQRAARLLSSGTSIGGYRVITPCRQRRANGFTGLTPRAIPKPPTRLTQTPKKRKKQRLRWTRLSL